MKRSSSVNECVSTEEHSDTPFTPTKEHQHYFKLDSALQQFRTVNGVLFMMKLKFGCWCWKEKKNGRKKHLAEKKRKKTKQKGRLGINHGRQGRKLWLLVEMCVPMHCGGKLYLWAKGGERKNIKRVSLTVLKMGGGEKSPDSFLNKILEDIFLISDVELFHQWLNPRHLHFLSTPYLYLWPGGRTQASLR